MQVGDYVVVPADKINDGGYIRYHNYGGAYIEAIKDNIALVRLERCVDQWGRSRPFIAVKLSHLSLDEGRVFKDSEGNVLRVGTKVVARGSGKFSRIRKGRVAKIFQPTLDTYSSRPKVSVLFDDTYTIAEDGAEFKIASPRRVVYSSRNSLLVDA